MKYTEKDIKEGMQLRCTDGGSFGFWEEGKIYTVTKLNNGKIGFHGDEMLGRTSRNAKDIAHYLNGNVNAKFELVGQTNDLKKKLEAKIEELRKEKYHLHDKRERLLQQENALSDKIIRLGKVLSAVDVLQEFE